MTKPDIEAVRALERFIASQGTPEHLLTFQGVLAAHEELHAKSAPSLPSAALVKPGVRCVRCGGPIQRCVAGDHWHHTGDPVEAHFPEPEGVSEFGWTWASDWDPDPTKPLRRRSMPQVGWEEWIERLERGGAPVRVWMRPVDSLGPWTEVER